MRRFELKIEIVVVVVEKQNKQFFYTHRMHWCLQQYKTDN